MPKTAVGSMKQKTLIEGDENLLEKNEILLQESSDFKMILKERNEQGKIDTYAVIKIEDYIKELEAAHAEGLNKEKDDYTKEGK